MLDILVIAPHPDDAELGMAGTILRCLDDGLKVGVLDLTTGEPTPRGSLEKRRAETQAATDLLELTWRKNLGLPNRQLEATLDARWAVAGVIRQTRPKWIFAPYWEDAHPDHVAATQLIEAARFWAKLSKSDLPGEPHHPQKVLYYFCVHLRLAMVPHFVVDISPYAERKREILACFESQFAQDRSDGPTLLDRLANEDAHWGHLIGTAAGEPFATREPLGLSTLRGLA